jgi:hypothetical protein
MSEVEVYKLRDKAAGSTGGNYWKQIDSRDQSVIASTLNIERNFDTSGLRDGVHDPKEGDQFLIMTANNQYGYQYTYKDGKLTRDF